LQQAAVGEPGGEAQGGAGFAGGASGDVEVAEQLRRAAALEAFGDVVADGKTGTLDLVAEVAFVAEGAVVDQREDVGRQFLSGVPNG
jgi:hypothetical protein